MVRNNSYTELKSRQLLVSYTEEVTITNFGIIKSSCFKLWRIELRLKEGYRCHYNSLFVLRAICAFIKFVFRYLGVKVAI